MSLPKINDRSFKKQGLKIIQKPKEIGLVKYSSDCGAAKGTLSFRVGLFYIALQDNGGDCFTVSLRVERPKNRDDKTQKVFSVVREFLYLYEIKKWILNLEKAILDTLFFGEDDLEEVRENHLVMKMLLELTADFSRLESILKDDHKKRQQMLG